MKKAALLAITASLLSISTLAHAQSAPTTTTAATTSSGPDCSAPDLTQADLDVCAAQDDKTVDGVLNSTYVKIRKQLIAQKQSDSDASLVNAERAWIAFRNLNCNAVAATYDGGSITDEIYESCLADMTKARTAELTSIYLTPQ